MKRFTLQLLLGTTFLSLSSCFIIKNHNARQPVSTLIADNNKTYQIDFLFTHDDCNVYRFRDKGRDVYFTNCNGDTASVTDSTYIGNRTNIK